MVEIGSSLREARRRRGLELAEVEAATMIRVRYLDALESERFELLPAGPYGRSFLREYAEFLGLDGDLFTSEYQLRLAAAEPEPPRPPPQLSGVLASRLGELPLARAAALVGAALLVGLAVWQLGGTGGAHVVKSTPPATKTPTPPPTPPAQQPATTGKPPTSRPPPLLAFTATRGSCWLSVRIGSRAGPTVYEQTLQQGQTARFRLRKQLWIRLGAPWNLDATIGRRPVTSNLPPNTGDITATTAGITKPVPATKNGTPTTVNNAHQLNTRGYQLMLARNYTAALPILRRAVAGLTNPADPVTAYTNFNLGQTLTQLSRCSEAIPYLQRAEQLEPASQQAHNALKYAQRCSR